MVNKDFFQALADLERERGISEEIFIDALSSALASAYKKMLGDEGEVEVRLNPDKNTIRFFLSQTVIEDDADLGDGQIFLEERESGRRCVRGIRSEGFFAYRGADGETGHSAKAA